jgi:hypothetical protein
MSYTNPTTGQEHGTGLLRPKHPLLCRSVRESAMPVYDRPTIISKLQAAGGKVRLPFTGPIYNQCSFPYCWNFSTIQMVRLALELADGDSTLLDCSLAPSLCDSIGSGDSIDDCWKKVVVPYGAPTAAFFGTDPTNADSMKWNPSQWPAGWQANAALRKGLELFTVDDFLGLASGVLNGHPGLLGVDCEGGGHAIGYAEVGLQQDGQSLYMATPGTWGGDYASGWAAYPGMPGWYRLTEDQCGAAFNGGYGAYVICGVKDDAAAPTPAANATLIPAK